jgi:hypothetical protein
VRQSRCSPSRTTLAQSRASPGSVKQPLRSLPDILRCVADSMGLNPDLVRNITEQEVS